VASFPFVLENSDNAIDQGESIPSLLDKAMLLVRNEGGLYPIEPADPVTTWLRLRHLRAWPAQVWTRTESPAREFVTTVAAGGGYYSLDP
jgi:hypothetical protein